jgi:antitoxin MazE
MATTVKVREKYQVTIPEDVRNEIPLTVGERVEVVVRNGEIVIRPMVEVPRGQAWFWSNEWQSQITQSMKNLKEGKIKVFKSVKEAKKDFGD